MNRSESGSKSVSRPAAVSRARVADQILDDLRSRIVDGSMPRGGRMPTEKELALEYGVSSQTIREAVRVLSSMGLVEVRHGSGAYVATNSEQILDDALEMLVRWDNVSPTELSGLMSVLTRYVAELSVPAATQQDIDRMRECAKVTAAGESEGVVVDAIHRFLLAFIASAHQPLLDALCGFLVRRLLGRQYPERSARFWKRWGAETAVFRLAIVDSLQARDLERLLADVDAFHADLRTRNAEMFDTGR